MADLLNVEPRTVAFGANSTTLAFAVARALGRDWKPGDEIVVTELDHRGNVDPWITLAQDKGVTVRWIKVDPGTFTLDLDQLDTLLNERTRLVAVGLASNAVGTINDVARVAARAHRVGVQQVGHGQLGLGDVRLGLDAGGEQPVQVGPALAHVVGHGVDAGAHHLGAAGAVEIGDGAAVVLAAQGREQRADEVDRVGGAGGHGCLRGWDQSG